MIPPRKWKTPRALKTSKFIGSQSKSTTEENVLESSMMSIEDEQGSDSEHVHINLDGLDSGRSPEPMDDRKRSNQSPATALFAARKRMRLAQSTIKKKSEAKAGKQGDTTTRGVGFDAGKKLNFGGDVPPENEAQSTARLAVESKQRMERLESFEKAASSMDALMIQQVESEILSMKRECPFSDTAFLHRSTQLLVALNQRASILQKADEFKSRGSSLYRAQQYLEAEQAYTQAIQLDPGRAVHYSNRAAALIMLGRFAEAIEDCNTATSLDPLFARAHLRSARASLSMGDAFTTYHKLNKVMRMQEEQGNVGGEVFREASEMAAQAKVFTDALDQAEIHFQNEDGEGAGKKALEALRVAPASIRARTLEVVSRLLTAPKAEENAELLESIVRELESSVGRAGYLDIYKYATILWNRAYITEAAALLKLSQGWMPIDAKERRIWELVRDVEDFLKRARRLRREGRYEDSLRFCDQAMNLCSQNDLLWAKICILRANLNVLMSRYSEAEQDCYQAIKRAPQFFVARIVLARALAGLGRFSEAEKEILFVETGFALLLKRNHRDELHEVREDIKAKVAAAAASSKSKQQQQHHGPRGEHFSQKQTSQAKATGVHPPSSSASAAGASKAKVNDENDMFAFLNQKHKVTHYMVLGVERNATKEEIRKAYKSKALRYHPDKNKDPRAPEAFKRIAEAMTIVSSPTKRRLYDISLY